MQVYLILWSNFFGSVDFQVMLEKEEFTGIFRQGVIRIITDENITVPEKMINYLKSIEVQGSVSVDSKKKRISLKIKHSQAQAILSKRNDGRKIYDFVISGTKKPNEVKTLIRKIKEIRCPFVGDMSGGSQKNGFSCISFDFDAFGQTTLKI